MGCSVYRRWCGDSNLGLLRAFCDSRVKVGGFDFFEKEYCAGMMVLLVKTFLVIEELCGLRDCLARLISTTLVCLLGLGMIIGGFLFQSGYLSNGLDSDY